MGQYVRLQAQFQYHMQHHFPPRTNVSARCTLVSCRGLWSIYGCTVLYNVWCARTESCLWLGCMQRLCIICIRPPWSTKIGIFYNSAGQARSRWIRTYSKIVIYRRTLPFVDLEEKNEIAMTFQRIIKCKTAALRMPYHLDPISFFLHEILFSDAFMYNCGSLHVVLSRSHQRLTA
jgi:hypothetical protein